MLEGKMKNGKPVRSILFNSDHYHQSNAYDLTDQSRNVRDDEDERYRVFYFYG